MNFFNWIDLAFQQEYLTAVAVQPCDRNYLLSQFVRWGNQLSLPVFFCNPGYPEWQSVTLDSDGLGVYPTGYEKASLIDLLRLDLNGIFIFDSFFSTIPEADLSSHVANIRFTLGQLKGDRYFVLSDRSFDLPIELHPLLPVLRYPYPNKAEVKTQIEQLCEAGLDESGVEAQRKIIQACIGLPRGEIDAVVKRALGRSRHPDEIAQYLLDYKSEKLRGRGINLLPKPDVPAAVGMEILDETLDKVRLLLQPEAEQRNLEPPKAILLLGIPGSGKSLAAKLAAQKIGATLVSCDWNGLVGSSVRESMANFDELIRFVSEIGTTILFFDEFEKAFSGWRSDAEGGVLGKLAGRLLSWMQDHTEPVVMLATINHLQMLPAEMVRRFGYVLFFGMPHAGAMHEIFKIHLAKYFQYELSEFEWRILLREYRGCTPDEIGKAVKRVADRLYFRDMQSGNFNGGLPFVALKDLVEERSNFTPASAQQDISDQIAGILNKAKFAMPVSGPDTSIFASNPQSLLGMEEKKGKLEVIDSSRFWQNLQAHSDID